MLTLPRLITRRPDGGLASRPVPALEELRTDPVGAEVTDRSDQLGAQLEFRLDADPGATGSSRVRLTFGPVEQLDIVIDHEANRVVIDRDHASLDPRADRGRYTIEGGTGGRVGDALRGFVDGSILELFLPGGRVATVRFYPTSPPPWRIELTRPGRARLRVWSLAG